jgi:hypothetical protein
MRKILYCLAAGAAAFLAGDIAAIMVMDIAGARGWGAFEAASGSGATATIIDRRHKSDRLRSDARRAPERTIASVEVVGLEQAAIVYRDRQGRILFQTDPLSNTTLLVRGVSLPQVTVRETLDAPAPAAVFPQQPPAGPVQPASPAATEHTPAGSTLPDGCEPAASPLSASGKSPLRARCISWAAPSRQFASLR